MKEFEKWLRDGIRFYDKEDDSCTPNTDCFKKDYFIGVQSGLRMGLQYLLENHIEAPISQQPVTNPNLLKCKSCTVTSEVECKQCKYTGCNHYWIKLAPIDQNNQKYMCLNCDEVK